MNGFGEPGGPWPLPARPKYRMTLRIYRVAPETGKRTRVRAVNVVEQEPWVPPPDLGNPCAFPPCACPMHRSGEGDAGGRDDTGR